MNRPSSKDRACISALLVTLIAFTSACAKREALPGDSVSEDGSVTLTPPKPTLTPKGLDLVPVLMELSRWGTRHEAGEPPPGILDAWLADPQAFIAGIRQAHTKSG